MSLGDSILCLGRLAKMSATTSCTCISLSLPLIKKGVDEKTLQKAAHQVWCGEKSTVNPHPTILYYRDPLQAIENNSLNMQSIHVGNRFFLLRSFSHS
jgi:hypothetical protein